MSYWMKRVYWGIAARLFPAYHRRAIQRNINQMCSIFFRKSPVQEALTDKYPTYGEQEHSSMMIPKQYNDTPHWD